MTKSTYIKVAAAVKKQLRKHRHCQVTRVEIITTAGKFASLAHDDNPRFSSVKFMEACGIGKE